MREKREKSPQQHKEREAALSLRVSENDADRIPHAVVSTVCIKAQV